MTLKTYWLFSGHVVTTHRNGTEHVKRLNVMLLTDDVQITRMDLAKAQEGMQQRFVNECQQIPGFRISDVYIESFGLLGQMTTEAFNAGFDKEVKTSGGVN